MNLDHIVLNVTDIEASLDFYERVIGLSVERLEDFRLGAVPFPSIRINDNTLIDLFRQNMRKAYAATRSVSSKLNHFCLALPVEEWASLRERLKVRGAEIIRDRTVNFGAHGQGVSMYFRDPYGNEIEAKYYEMEPRTDDSRK